MRRPRGPDPSVRCRLLVGGVPLFPETNQTEQRGSPRGEGPTGTATPREGVQEHELFPLVPGGRQNSTGKAHARCNNIHVPRKKKRKYHFLEMYIVL